MKTIIISLLLFFTVQAQNIWYVDRDTSGHYPYNGRSWETAWRGFDSTSYTPDSYGINWAILSAGDTVYVSGGTDSTCYTGWTTEGITISGGGSAGTAHTFASGNPVVIIPAKYSGRTTGEWANHIGDVYLTTRTDNDSRILNVHNKSNVKIYGFIIYDRRVTSPGTTALVKIGNADWGDRDSLVYFENNHVIGTGLSALLTLTGSKITINDNIIEQLYNTHVNDQDAIGMNSGRGGHTIDNNVFILREAYEGLDQSANASVTCTDNSLTDTRLSMTTDYHVGWGGYILAKGFSGVVTANNSNTFTVDEWTPVGISKAAEATVSATSTSLTWVDGSYTVDLYIGWIIYSKVNASDTTQMTITSNTGTTFYGDSWDNGTPDPTNYGYWVKPAGTHPEDGTYYVVNSDAHRDGIQISNIGLGESLGGVYATERLTMTISNNLLIAPENGTVAWTSMLYSSGTYCNHNYLVYNNILVNSKTNTSITGINIGQSSDAPMSSYSTSCRIFNNTIITKGFGSGGGITAFNHDTLEIKNNLVVSDTTLQFFYNLDDASHFSSRIGDIDYNYYGVYGSPTSFGFDNANYRTWDAWNTLGHDTNGDTTQTTNITFTDKYDTNAVSYYTTSGRDLGTDLSTYFTVDILGNPRSGTWDIGALEYDEGTVDSLPNAFTFTDITNATRSTVYTSNAVTLAGFDSAYARAGGAEYNVNGGGYVTGYTKVFPDDIVRVRLTSSSSYSTATSVTLTVGTRTDTYTVTTLAEPPATTGGIAKGSNGVPWRDKNGILIKVKP